MIFLCGVVNLRTPPVRVGCHAKRRTLGSLRMTCFARRSSDGICIYNSSNNLLQFKAQTFEAVYQLEHTLNLCREEFLYKSCFCYVNFVYYLSSEILSHQEKVIVRLKKESRFTAAAAVQKVNLLRYVYEFYQNKLGLFFAQLEFT